MKLGFEGSEILNNILNFYYENIIGIFPISIKIGLASGEAKFYILRESDFINPILEGDGINNSALAELNSSLGKTILFLESHIK